MTAANRARRYRQRRRRERAVLPVEVEYFELVEAFIDTGLVPVEDSEDRGAIARAASKVIRGWRLSVTRDA